jgi:hypothetical protein
MNQMVRFRQIKRWANGPWSTNQVEERQSTNEGDERKAVDRSGTGTVIEESGPDPVCPSNPGPSQPIRHRD